MKKFIKPLLTGIAVTLVMVFVMLKITLDFQLLLFIGAVIFFSAGLISSDIRIHHLLTTFIITISYLLLFIVLVLEQLPVWYFVPIYFAITLLGILYKRHKQKIVAPLLLLISLMFFLAIKIIPTDIENSLTQTRFEQLPQFSIIEMSGNVVHSKTLEGKVVVLDFFGTWCKPCIGELKELDKIQMAFKDNKDVVFYVIDANYGNDSPEKFKAFIDKHNYKFQFAYDYNSEIFKLLKLQKLGIPVILIIDKKQNIRIQHVGYNPAETNFSENMIETINSLM